MPPRENPAELRIDRVACTGHGVCAAVLQAVDLDEWGYPIVRDARAAAEAPDLRSAVALCPARALYVTGRNR